MGCDLKSQVEDDASTHLYVAGVQGGASFEACIIIYDCTFSIYDHYLFTLTTSENHQAESRICKLRFLSSFALGRDNHLRTLGVQLPLPTMGNNR